MSRRNTINREVRLAELREKFKRPPAPRPDPRSFWLIAGPEPTALPRNLARVWRRFGRPVLYGTPAEAVAALAAAPAPEAAPEPPAEAPAQEAT